MDAALLYPALTLLLASVSGLSVYIWQSRRYQSKLAERDQLLQQHQQQLQQQQEQASQQLQQLQNQLLSEQQQQQLHNQYKDEQLAQSQQQTALSQQKIAQLEQQTEQQQAQHQQQLHKEQQAAQQAQVELSRVREQAQHSEQQLTQLRQQHSELTEQSQQQIQQQQQQLANLETQLATEKQAREQQAESAAEQLALLENNKAQLLKEFEHLSQKIFEQKNTQLQQQLQQQQKQAREHNKEGLDALLTPFKQQLDGLRKKVEDVHLHDSKDRAALAEQIAQLHQLNQQMSSEAKSLTTALRGEQKVQGNWGEMVLETVLERSGLRLGEEYVREQNHNDEEGKNYRPDVIINLPDGKHIIVDSKVSLSAYTDYINAGDDAGSESSSDSAELKAEALKRHIDSVRAHIKGLSDKAYQQLPNLNSPDFVFLFMPVEPAFMLAFQHDERLFNDAFEQRIVVVTPTTLLATLRTVSSLWAIERRNKSTEKLAEQAGKVYDKLATVVEKMETLGKQLNTAQGTYEGVWTSLKAGRGNLLNQADNFRKLGVRVKKELAKNLVEEANAEAELYEALEQQPQKQSEKPAPVLETEPGIAQDNKPQESRHQDSKPQEPTLKENKSQENSPQESLL